MGSITATVYSQRLHPLSRRVIGPSETVKGIVRVTKMLEDHLIVDVLREYLPIGPGDVMAKIQGNPPQGAGWGTRKPEKDLWAVLEER
jgi:hypothetical protein